MKYNTYISASIKMRAFGQEKRAQRMFDHGKEMASKKINQMKFDILIGEVREVHNCNYHSSTFFKSGNAWRFHVIFKSDTSTHIIECSLDGKLTWSAGNKFSNRKSVKTFKRLINELFTFEHDLSTVDNIDEVIVEERTFYI